MLLLELIGEGGQVKVSEQVQKENRNWIQIDEYDIHFRIFMALHSIFDN